MGAPKIIPREKAENGSTETRESIAKNIEEALIAVMVLKDHFRNAEITKHNRSGFLKVRLQLNNALDYDEVIKCFEYLPLDPWADDKKRTITIDNRYDIAYLLEFGIIDYDNLSDDAKNALGISLHTDPKERRLPVSAPAFMYDQTEMAKIFDPMMGPDSDFREVREDKIGPTNLYNSDSFEESMGLDERPDETTNPETKYFNHGDTGWLYRQHLKKYERKPGGKLFRKIYRADGQFRLVEIEESEQAELLAKAKAGDKKAENEILIMNIPLIYLAGYRLAKKFPSVNLSDLLQIGIIQMHKCIKDYTQIVIPESQDTDENLETLVDKAITEEVDMDTKKKLINKAKFSTFATLYMGYIMFNSVFKIRDDMHIPKNMLNKFGKINAILNRLKNQGEELTLEKKIKEITAELKISYKAANELLQDYENLKTIKYVRPDEVENAPEMIDDSNGPHKKVQEIGIKRMVGDTLDGLTRRQAKVLRARFGFNGQAEDTLEEIGDRFDITRERVRQMEASAIRKLKNPSSRLLLGNMTEDDDLKYGVSVKNNGPLVGKPLDPNYINFLNLDIDDLQKIISTDKSFILVKDRVLEWISMYDDELDRLSSVKNFPNKDKEVQEIKEKKVKLYTVAMDKIVELEPEGRDARINWQYHIDVMSDKLKNLKEE